MISGLPGPLAPGTALGKYQLLQRLAVGGMAEIYLARVAGIQGFEKYVVLKRILPNLALDQNFVSMFLNEARLAATLHHANVVQVYDIGEVGGNYFFTMEYVHGEDLRRILSVASKKGTGIPLGNALAIVIGVAAGLHSAHERRDSQGKPREIVHRDVSPSNVLVTYDGTVKVVDFGIAKAASESSLETHTGNLKGKLSYMSPEQCLQSEAIDRRSDVFALGILLWELTTGKRLFHEENDYATIKKIVESDATPPRWVRAGYPHELERIVVKALRRDRDERYLSALDLQTELERFAIEYKVTTSSVALARTMRELFGEREEPWHRVPEPVLGTELTEPAPIPPGPAAEIVQAADAAEVAHVRAGRLRRWIAAGALALSTLAVTAALLVGHDQRPLPAIPSAPEPPPAATVAPPAPPPPATAPAPEPVPVQAPPLLVEKPPAAPETPAQKRPASKKKTARPIDEPFLPK